MNLSGPHHQLVSGPKYVVDEQRLNHLVEVYSPKGAFAASLGWFRSSGNPVTAYTQEVPLAVKDRLTTPTTVLWQEYDPIFPQHWSGRLDQFFKTSNSNTFRASATTRRSRQRKRLQKPSCGALSR